MKNLFLSVLALGLLFTGCPDGGSNNGKDGEKTPSAPSAPGAPTLTAGNGTLTVSWTAVTGATGYDVYHNTADDHAGETKVADQKTGCELTGLANGTTYYVWIKAKNSEGESGYSPSANKVPTYPGMVFVRGGTFQMGAQSADSDLPNYDSDANGDESPVHDVTLSPFFIGKYEVTQSEYEAVMGDNPSNFKTESDAPNHPVEKVSWYDALAYCNRLSAKEGLTPVYYTDSGFATVFSPSGDVPDTVDVHAKWDADGYRLPTEAEWEYAARGGADSQGYKYSGGDTLGDVGWHDGNSDSKTHPVGEKSANELGLYDMSGNVWERCWDWLGSYDNSLSNDPRGASSGTRRVIRGGSWNRDASGLRSADRLHSASSDRLDHIGFRVVRSAGR